MRILGVLVVIIGVVALGFVARDAIGTAAFAPGDQATSRDTVVAVPRLIAWAAVVGIAALVTVAGGLGSLLMSRRGGTPPRRRRHDA